MAIDTKVRVEYIPKDGSGVINTLAFTGKVNNVSGFTGTYVGSPLEMPSTGARPFILGASKLGDGSVFGGGGKDGKYPGAMFRAMWGVRTADGARWKNPIEQGDVKKFWYFEKGTTSDTWYTADRFQLTVSGTAMKQIMIYFDSVVGQFPTSLTINGNDITNDNTFVVFAPETPVDVFTIYFNDWNVDKFPVRITGIVVDLDVVYDKHGGLMDTLRGSESMPENTLPYNARLGQYGKFDVKDIDRRIKELEELNLIDSDIKVDVYLDDKLVGRYLFDTWDYDDNASEIAVELKDEIPGWDNIIVSEIELQGDLSALDFYNLLIEQDNSIEFEPLSTEINDKLLGIRKTLFYLEGGKLSEQWNKFHSITATNGGMNKDGKYEVRND